MDPEAGAGLGTRGHVEPSSPRGEDEATHGVSFREAARFWVKLGFINFGGPTGQIAIMHEELVDRRRWISNGRFLHALNYCMLLPGPEAQQLAIYVGWLLHRVRGGLVAGIAFILPAFFLIMGLSWTYAEHGDVPVIAGTFSGLQAAVVGIVAAALIRIGGKALRNPVMVAIAVASFVAIFLVHLPFPILILGVGLLGLIGGRLWPATFTPAEQGPVAGEAAIRDDRSAGDHTRVTAGRSLRVLLVGLVAWMVPLALVAMAPGSPDVWGEEAVFFSQAAMVTFGGAYAVLAYINQAAVQQFGWLLPGQMVTGLGLAESTPGPLIMVTEFVGFLGAPFVERLRGNRALSAALSAVTAAVVGVILNLAVVFGIHALFDRVREAEVLGGPLPVPTLSSLDPFAAIVAVASFAALWRFRLNILWVVGGSALAGIARVLVA